MKDVGILITKNKLEDINSLTLSQRTILRWFKLFSSGEDWAHSIGYQIQQKISFEDFKVLQGDQYDNKERLIQDLQSKYPDDVALRDYLNDVAEGNMGKDSWEEFKKFASIPNDKHAIAERQRFYNISTAGTLYIGLLYILVRFHFVSLIARSGIYMLEKVFGTYGEVGLDIFTEAIRQPIDHFHLKPEIGFTVVWYVLRLVSTKNWLFEGTLSNLQSEFFGQIEKQGLGLVKREEGIPLVKNLLDMENNFGMKNPETQGMISQQCKADIDRFVKIQSNYDSVASIFFSPSPDVERKLGVAMVSTWLKCNLFLTSENEKQIRDYANEKSAITYYEPTYTIASLVNRVSGSEKNKKLEKFLRLLVKYHKPVLGMDVLRIGNAVTN